MKKMTVRRSAAFVTNICVNFETKSEVEEWIADNSKVGSAAVRFHVGFRV